MNGATLDGQRIKVEEKFNQIVGCRARGEGKLVYMLAKFQMLKFQILVSKPKSEILASDFEILNLKSS